MAEMENVVSAQAHPDHLTRPSLHRLLECSALQDFGPLLTSSLRIGDCLRDPLRCQGSALPRMRNQFEKMGNFIHGHVDQLL